MNSVNCSSRISTALMRENLKRYWLLGVGGLVAYLITVIFPLIINHDDSWYFSELFSETYFPIIGCGAVIPILTAFVLWHFLFNQSGTAFVHSLPYSRKQIFHTNNLCSVLLIGLPILITGVLLLVIRLAFGPIYDSSLSMINGAMPVDVMPYTEIFKWIAFVLVLNLVVYVISMTAGFLTGLPLMQPIISCGFLAIGPVAVLLIEYMNECMLYGYVGQMKNTLITALSPIMTMDMGSKDGMKFMLIWLAVGIVLYFVAALLYKIRKLERCTEVLVFKPTRPIVKYVLSLMAAIMGGLAFYYIIGNNQEILFVLGALLGGLIAYIGLDMIIAKSVKIKGFVKGFGIMLAIMVVFFGAYYLDIFGYAKYLPEPEDVEGVSITGPGLADYYAGDDYAYSEDGIFNTEEESTIFLKEENNIKEAILFHGDMAATKGVDFGKHTDGNWMYLLSDGRVVNSEEFTSDYSEAVGDWADFYGTYTVSVEYKLKNGKHVYRMYDLPTNFVDSNTHMGKILNTDEYKKANFDIVNWNLEEMDIDSLSFYLDYSFYSGNDGDTTTIVDKAKIKELAKAIKSDVEGLNLKEMVERGQNSGLNDMTLSFMINKSTKNNSAAKTDSYENLYEYVCNVNSSYKNTIALLKAWDIVHIYTADDVSLAEVSKIEAVKDGFVSSKFEVNDPKLIQTIIDTGIDSCWGSNSIYVVNLYFKDARDDNRMTLYYNEETGNPFE